MLNFLLLGSLIVLGIIFSFSNGYNNSANIVAIPIGTRALLPTKALILAGIFEFVGAYFLGQAVAKMVALGIVDINFFLKHPHINILLFVMFLSSIFFNIFYTFLGFPVSSSHILISSLVGGSIALVGMKAVNWNNVLKIFSSLVIAPTLAFIFSYILTKIVYFFSRGASLKINNLYKNLQILSSLSCALAHGSNDGQRNVGILVFSLVLLKAMKINDNFLIPNWLGLICALSISIGVMLGGLNVIKTIGMTIYRIKHINGFVAQTTASLIIYLASILGIPLSTTHVVAASVMGTGAAERVKAVRWLVSKDIFLAWMLTIPFSIIFSFVFTYLLILITEIL